MCSEQVPHIPSLQSLSKCTGSSPFSANSSLSTSNISKKDMSSEISPILYSLKPPLSLRSFCLQIFNVKFIIVMNFNCLNKTTYSFFVSASHSQKPMVLCKAPDPHHRL